MSDRGGIGDAEKGKCGKAAASWEKWGIVPKGKTPALSKRGPSMVWILYSDANSFMTIGITMFMHTMSTNAMMPRILVSRASAASRVFASFWP